MSGYILWGLAACLFATGLALALCKPGSDADDAMERMWGR